MVSVFLFLLPMVPYAAFRAGEQVPRPLAPAPASPLPPPPFGFRVEPGPSGGDGPTSPFSPRRIRDVSRDWEWKALETTGWKLLLTPSFVVRGDVPIAELRTVGATLEEFLRMAKEALGGDSSGLVFSARVFASLRDFQGYATRSGASNAESFYDPRSAELVVCLEETPSPVWL